ncbi:hypothetical protein WJX72_009935 [[Myrmecia] bisecta]|uniref:Peptidase C-terminal archaeal/bacterial domain-containing protein n=1 Tax=[Myrmecia] bisecta TaxID=41462 RepID=A0AAW1PPU9_9CHLO
MSCGWHLHLALWLACLLLGSTGAQSSYAGLCSGSLSQDTNSSSSARILLKSRDVAELCHLLDSTVYGSCEAQLPEFGIALAQVTVSHLPALLKLDLISYCAWDSALSVAINSGQRSTAACPRDSPHPDWSLGGAGQGATAFILGQGVDGLGGSQLISQIFADLRALGALIIEQDNTPADKRDPSCVTIWNGACVVPTPAGLRVTSSGNGSQEALASQAGQLAGVALQFYGLYPHAGAQQAADKIMEAAAADFLAQRDIAVSDHNDFVIALPGRDFSSALVIPALPYLTNGSTQLSANTYTANVTACGSSAPGGDVVYLYTPGQDANVTVDICGSAEGTMIHVYESTAQQLLGCTTVSALCRGGAEGSLSVWMRAGELYYVVVDSASPWYRGPYQLSLSAQLPGDLATNALVVSSLPFSANGTTTGFQADYQPSDGDAAACGGLGPDVVYELRVPAATFVEVSLCAAAFPDATLQVYRGSVSGSNLIGCSTDGCGGAPMLRVFMKAATTYFIVVDGRSADSAGPYQLDIAAVAEPLGNRKGAAKTVKELPFTDTAAIGQFSHDYTPPCGSPDASPDVVYELRVAASQYVDLSSCRSEVATQLWVTGPGGSAVACDAGACGAQSRLSAIYLEAGVTYHVFLQGSTFGGAGAANYTLDILPALQGNSIQNPWAVDALPFSHSSNTRRSVDNVQSPACRGGSGPDTAYRLDAVSTRFVEAALCDAAFETLLYVYRAKTDSLGPNVALPRLESVGCNRRGCGSASKMRVTLLRGYTYFFVVDGWRGAGGTYTLTLTRPSEPYGNRFQIPQPAVQSLPFQAKSDTTLFSNDYAPPCMPASTAPDVIYTLDLVLPGFADILLCSSAVTPVLHAYRDNPGPSTLLACGTPFNDSGRMCSLVQLQYWQTDIFSVYLVVDSADASGGPFQLDVTYTKPGNILANAKAIAALPFTDAASTAGYRSSHSVGSTAGCPSAGPDVVYAYTPGADVYAAVSLCSGGGSFAGATLFIYQDQVDASHLRGCSSPGCGAKQSSIPGIQLLASYTYYVVVDGQAETSAGPYTLTVQPVPEPLGNRIGDALPVGALPFVTSNTTAGAFADDYNAGPYLQQCGGQGAPDLAYELKPAQPGVIEVSLCRSNFTTSLYVMDSKQRVITCAAFTQGCGNGLQSRLRMYVTAAEVYYIIVDGFNGWGDAGTYELSVQSVEEPAGNSFDNPKVVDSLPYADQDTTANFHNALPAAPCAIQAVHSTPSAQYMPQVIYRLDGTDLICSVDIRLSPAVENLTLAIYEEPQAAAASAGAPRQPLKLRSCTQVPFTATLQSLMLPTNAMSAYYISIQGPMVLSNFTLNVLPTPCAKSDVPACKPAKPAAGAAQTEALARTAQLDPGHTSALRIDELKCGADGVEVSASLAFSHPVETVTPDVLMINGGAGTILNVLPSSATDTCAGFTITGQLPTAALADLTLYSTTPVCVSLVSDSVQDVGGVQMPSALICQQMKQCV